VKVMQRRATTAVALSFGLISAPAALLAQRPGMAPGPDTPRLLVAVFQSPDRVAGVQTADAVRNRISTSVPVRTLYVIPRNDIVAYLESSGYKADSSLGPADLRELARLLRADEILYGTVSRGASGVRLEPRLLLARDTRYSQPLPAIDAGNPNEAARNIERAVLDARKQLADNRACENAIRDKMHAKAIASAQAGIVKYPNATIARLCLANAFMDMKAPADSALKVLNEVIRIDPKNSLALGFASVVYKEKGDQENAIRALVRMLELEPGNQTLQSQVVTELAQLGKPTVALPIIDTLLRQNPGDPTLMRQKWLLTLAAAAAADTGAPRYAFIEQAIAAGESMTRADTSLADSTYYSRMILTASAAPSQAAKGAELAARATQKFPRVAEFWVLKATAERKAGQLQAADASVRQALSIDAKYPNAALTLAQINLDMNRPDTAVAIARRSVAAGEDARQWGGVLLAAANAAFRVAQASEAVADYQKVLALAQEADRMAPQPLTKFFVGVSAFQIGVDALRSASEEQKAKKPANARMCAFGRTAQDNFLITQTNIIAGGQLPEMRATVTQVMGVVQQYSPNVDQIVKQYCK
jgi:tetratricopeptide (TPR) repeat protein